MSASPRRPLVAANWKMNLTEVWSIALVDDLLPRVASLRGAVDLAVAPSFPCLSAVRDRVNGSEVALAAQDVHWEEKGAFTGEVSPRMLEELGVRLVIAGHSERRIHSGDTDERVQRKVAAIRAHGMVPILCVGEQEAERDEGRTLEIVRRQLVMGLAEAHLADGAELVVAYEPVWAIGTGRTPTADQVREVHRMIREQLAASLGAGIASAVRILYGGSVTPENAPQLLHLDEVDGALVGGASLDAVRFAGICAAAV